MKTEKTLSMESVVARNNEIIHSDMDDETVMMSIENGEYYGVNPVGSRIWELVETPVAVSRLCRTLEDEYRVEHEQCSKDVLAFLTELAKKNLISIKNG